MPSAFELFGELKVDTKQFVGSLASAEAQLKHTGAEMDKLEAKSSSLGSSLTRSPLQTDLSKVGKATAEINADTVKIAASAKEAASAEHDFALAASKAAGASEQTAAAIAAMELPLVGIVAAVAAVAAALFLSYNISKDIREEAEKQLKIEEAIAASINKRYIAAAAFKERLKDEASARSDDRFYKSDDIVALQMARERLLREHDDNANAITDAMNRKARARVTSPEYVAAETESAEQLKIQKQQENQISKLTARIEELKEASKGDDSVTFYSDIQKRQLDNYTASVKALVEEQKQVHALAVKKDAFNLDGVKSLEELKRFHFKATAATQIEAFEQEVSIARRREQIVKESIRQAKEYAAEVKRAEEGYTKGIQSRVAAVNLRDQARQFSAGETDDFAAQKRVAARMNRVTGPANVLNAMRADMMFEEKGQSIQQKLQAELQAIGGQSASGFQSDFYKYSYGDDLGLGKKIVPPKGEFDEFKAREADRAIIAATNGLDPAQLTEDQRQVAAGARNREAKALEKDAKAQQEMLKKLSEAIESGAIIRIVDEAPGKTKITTAGTKATTEQRYH